MRRVLKKPFCSTCTRHFVDAEEKFCFECDAHVPLGWRSTCRTCRSGSARPEFPMLSWNAEGDECPLYANCEEDTPRIMVRFTCGDKCCIPCFISYVDSCVKGRQLVWDAATCRNCIRCYNPGCRAGRADRNMLRLAGDSLFDVWRTVEYDAALSTVKALSCPNPHCRVALMGLPPVEEQRVVRCLECSKQFCQVRAACDVRVACAV